MRAVKADVTSSKPISLSKAEATLSHFAASETGARPDVAAYLKRAATAFKELVDAHREIRHQRKISQKDDDELVEEEEDSRRWEKKKNKERGSERDSLDGNLISEKHGSLGIASVEANGGVKEKTAEEKEMRRIVGFGFEFNGIVESKKEKKQKKREVREERKVEMKSKVVEYDEKRSDECNSKVNRKREGRLLEGGKLGLFFDESIASEKKKRKRLDIEQGGMDGDMELHEGKGKKKRRKAE